MQAGFNTNSSGGGGGNNNNTNNNNNNGEAAAAAAAGYMVDQAGCSHYVNMAGGQYGFMPGGHHHHMISGAAAHAHHLPPPMSGGAGSASDHLYLDSIKASILSHPLFMQLLAAHVACLQVAAPFAAGRGAQLAASSPQDFVASYLAALPPSSAHHLATSSPYDRDELNHFMVSYILLLQSFKEELQEHLTTQATEAMAACWEIEQSLYDLTGVSVGPGDGSLMPQDEKRSEEINYNYSYSNYNYNDYIARSNAGLVDAYFCQDFDKSLIDHVRRELKKELKEDYRSKLRDVREEILRKRRAGKLPGETTHVLKDWWTTHAKWPYPTEEEKARLAEESGLELKQINNWFINQRKRNWQSEINQDASASNDEKMDNANPLNVSLSLNVDMHESSSQHDGTS